MFSAIARIESYKHYQAGAIHKEAVRELTNYKNPNYDPSLTVNNVYLERMFMSKPFEKWIYDYRAENNITGRYIEHSANPKSETNVLCQAFFAVPGYIRTLDRSSQIQVLNLCYDFFKSEFPNVPVLEAVIHFDETEPHLQINFLPVVERDHKKRGREKIFSTTLLMPGRDFFPKFQDRFYAYMEEKLQINLQRNKGSKAKHLSPKEYREVTEELQFWEQQIAESKRESSLQRSLNLAEQIRLYHKRLILAEKSLERTKAILSRLSLADPSFLPAYREICRELDTYDKARRQAEFDKQTDRY